MKILYAIQGTGNGHISRARDIIPILQKKGELDLLVSGTACDVDLPYEIKYRYKGLSFVFGKKGGVDLLATYKKGKLKRLYKEIIELPVEDYDLVINDFEPVSAWACKLRSVPCIGLSHQAAVANKNTPRPKKIDPVGLAILKNYAPVSQAYGFHFKSYANNIFTPVIRSQIRNANPGNQGHYTVYLPAYADESIIKVLGQVSKVKWQVFSKHSKESFQVANVSVQCINNEAFVESFINCTGIICGAGFEAPAEALFMDKKLLVIPMKGQFEQQCNAAALALLGVPVIKSLKNKHLEKIKQWVDEPTALGINYPDTTEAIIDLVINSHAVPVPETSVTENNSKPVPLKKFRKLSLGKIIYQLSH